MASVSSGTSLAGNNIFRVLSEASPLPHEVESDSSITLHQSQLDPVSVSLDHQSPPFSRISKRKKKPRRKKHNQPSIIMIPENSSPDQPQSTNTSHNQDASSICVVSELRQRNVSSASLADVSDAKISSPFVRANGNLETESSLDWNNLTAENPDLFSSDHSPLGYIMNEFYTGNALRKTSSIGSENDRERVYDTIFRLPWRCELLIDFGFFVCLDTFLSLLTVVPTRLASTVFKRRHLKSLSAADISDISCLIILSFGVLLLARTDISLIYHMIRGQGTIKLYVVYNVLEIFDKLCQSFGGDVIEALFNTIENLVNCSSEAWGFWLQRLFYDQTLAAVFSILHSFILLAQAITLSTCIVAHNNALLAMLVSNNFTEIKSNVFKRFSRDNLHSLAYSDTVERFHISAFLLFVLAQNILEAEGPWFKSFLFNASMVFLCEVLVDVIKHSFLAKFNDIKPIAYSEFLEDLCHQTLQRECGRKKNGLTFIPFAPACVVIRVMTPVYAAHLPVSPWWWRAFWVFLLLAVTHVMLTTLKIMVALALQKLATWYVRRCQRRKLHTD